MMVRCVCACDVCGVFVAIMSVLELDECRLYHNHGVLDLLLFGRDRTQPEGQTLDTTKVREYYNLEKTRHQ